jgi:hypothetical protein
MAGTKHQYAPKATPYVMEIGYMYCTVIAAHARFMAAVAAATADRQAGRGMPRFASSNSGRKPKSSLQIAAERQQSAA